MKTVIKIHYVLNEEDKKSIKKQMIDKDLTLRQMAKNLGVSASYLCEVIKGGRSFTNRVRKQFESQGIILPEYETVYDFEKYKEFFKKVNNEIYMNAYDESCLVDYEPLHKLLVGNLKKYIQEVKDD